MMAALNGPRRGDPQACEHSPSLAGALAGTLAGTLACCDGGSVREEPPSGWPSSWRAESGLP